MRTGKRTRQRDERAPKQKRQPEPAEAQTAFSAELVRGALGPETCDRCNQHFSQGYRWTSLGIPLLLCGDCTADIEESVASYGERGKAADRRLLARIRAIGLDAPVRERGG